MLAPLLKLFACASISMNLSSQYCKSIISVIGMCAFMHKNTVIFLLVSLTRLTCKQFQTPGETHYNWVEESKVYDIQPIHSDRNLPPTLQKYPKEPPRCTKPEITHSQ